MNFNDAATHLFTATPSTTLNVPDKRLKGSWIVVARLVWATVTLLELLIFALSLPAYYSQLHVICATANLATCQTGQLTQDDLGILTRLGISLESYSIYTLVIVIVASLVFLAVGTLIFLRKSQDVIGLFSSFLLISFGCFGTTRQLAASLAAQYPDVLILQVVGKVALIQYPAILLFFYIFPDGRPVPRWSWLVVIPGVIFASGFAFPPDSPFSIGNWSTWLFSIAILIFYGNGFVFQIYRYWWVSNSRQRQQTKWVLFAFVVSIAFNILDGIAGLVPLLNDPDSFFRLIDATFNVFFFLLPIPFGILAALLRYRLWDIDSIINKALVYGLLTLTLLLVYLALVWGLQTFIASFFGADNSIVLVGSTLVVLALFQPLRRRVQQMIDWRFYRSKYDKAKIVAGYEANLRNEMELNQIRNQFVLIVDQTMQPTQTFLWIGRVKKYTLRDEDG